MKFIPTESGWYWATLNNNPCVVTVIFRQPHMYTHDWQEAIIHLGSLSVVHLGFLDKSNGGLLNHSGYNPEDPENRHYNEGFNFEIIRKIDEADVPYMLVAVEESE